MLQGENQDFRRWIADRAALPMFCLSVLFLAVVAAVLVLVIEAPAKGYRGTATVSFHCRLMGQ